MGFISGYPKDVDISLSDKLLGTDAENSSFTKNFEIADVVSFLRTQNIGSQGPIGPQGIQGNTGAAGAVGPAGLNWQGTWVSGTTYFENDAVSYNGASWFLYTVDNDGSENESPQDDTSHWALLASQGATGPVGVQGPTGAQGPSGTTTYTEESKNTNSLSVAENPATPTSKITKNFTRAYVTSAIDNFLGLSNIGKVTGDFFVVQNKSTTLDLVIVPIDYARFLQPSGFASQVNFTLGPNRYARFTLTDTTSGSDKVFMVEVINPLGAVGIVKTTKITITEAQILNMFSSPVSILQSFQAGVIRIPTSIICKRASSIGTAYTVAANQFKLSNNYGDTFTMNFFNTPLSSVNGSSFTLLSIYGLNAATNSLEAMEYFLGAYTSNPTAGTGDIDIYITYNEIRL